MSQAADKAIDRWADRVLGRTDRPNLASGNIICRGDRIYSYGEHFEMARPLRDKKGEVHAFLLNGDTYSNTTTSHQSSVRGVLSRRSNHPLVIIPHEALAGAGIDRDSVQVVHVLPDRMETINHHYTQMQEGWIWRREPVMGYRDRTTEELQALADAETAKELESYQSKVRYAEKDPGGYFAKHWLPEHLEPPKPKTTDDVRDRREWCKVGTRDVLYTGYTKTQEINVRTDDDGVTHYEWTTHRHWLGESLIRAKVTWTKRVKCPRCDGTGRIYGPLREYERPQCRTCWGDATISKQSHRWAYFLSGFDHAEARPLYFLCELPRGVKPTTVAEAYEALKPDPVKLAEQMGRPVERQGDIFAIPTQLDAKVLKAKGARIARRKVDKEHTRTWRRVGDFPYILNTNHTATEVAYLPDGVTLARGTMYHDPADRPQDHARHKLGDGKTWHIVIKNTVPTTVRR
jgi:hypothetical protein